MNATVTAACRRSRPQKRLTVEMWVLLLGLLLLLLLPGMRGFAGNGGGGWVRVVLGGLWTIRNERGLLLSMGYGAKRDRHTNTPSAHAYSSRCWLPPPPFLGSGAPAESMFIPSLVRHHKDQTLDSGKDAPRHPITAAHVETRLVRPAG